jgi:membrane-associated phospholipid phosphatase
MNDSSRFRGLFHRSLVALLLAAALVAACYFYIDRPFAWFIHNQRINSHEPLRWLTYPPPIVEAWTPVALVLLVVRRASGPFHQWELTLFAACVAMIVADQFRESLGYVFGRTWPGTFENNNPSLIKDGVFGFHFFHGGAGYSSFPSGHMARTLAVVAVYWIAYPRWRWLGILAAAAIAVGLLGMNYHFVGDVVAGSFVGALVGAYAAGFAGLEAPSRVESARS